MTQIITGLEGLSSDVYFPGYIVHKQGDWALVKLDGPRKWIKDYIVVHKCPEPCEGWTYSMVFITCERCGEIC